MSEREGTRYYAFYSATEYKEFLSFLKAKKNEPKFIIKREYIGQLGSFYNDEIFYHYRWRILDLEQKETKVRAGEWALVSIDDPIERSMSVSVGFTDPSGEVKYEKFHSHGNASLIIAIIEKLKLLKKHSSWEEYYKANEEPTY